MQHKTLPDVHVEPGGFELAAAFLATQKRNKANSPGLIAWINEVR